VSPHVAFLTGEALNNIAHTTLENLEHAFGNDGSKSNTMVF
jgi:lactate dehydrogenase-like 2-hydroxyacid dehydrogenase